MTMKTPEDESEHHTPADEEEELPPAAPPDSETPGPEAPAS
jgi:hypothetical protein